MGCNSGDKCGTSEINTQECVQESTCIPSTASQCITVGSCTCGCNPCQCEQQRAVGSLPFYNQAASCQEDHKQFLIQQTFITAVATGKAFNMPACDASVTIYLPGVQRLQVGSYLWNVTYGYLRVVSFDFTTGTAVVINECQSGNASPGTAIPECTMFNVVDPPYEPENPCDGDAVYITANFVVPAVAASVNIEVTNIEGLTVDMVVQVGSGAYTITAIVDGDTITIRNDGLGAVPGSTVTAYDVNGNCITPVVPYSENPCDNDAVDYGAIVVCKQGVASPLDAAAVGQIPVVIDADTNEVEFQTIDLPEEICTYLTACLNLVNGVDSYTLVVADSSIFTIGELLTIHWPTIEGDLWLVTGIPDGTHVDVTSVDPNTVTDTVPEDTLVCVAHCCDQLEYMLEHPCDRDWSEAFKTATDTDNFNEASAVAEGNTFTSSTETSEISNDTCNEMKVMVHVSYGIQGYFYANQGAESRYVFTPYFGYSTAALPGSPGAPAMNMIHQLTRDQVHGCGPGGAPCDANNSYASEWISDCLIITLPAQTALRIDAHLTFYNQNYRDGSNICCPCESLTESGDGVYNISRAYIKIGILGVAVQAA